MLELAAEMKKGPGHEWAARNRLTAESTDVGGASVG